MAAIPNPPEWDIEPELLLGPGPKLQHDDPFVSLYSEFHNAIRRAKVTVVVGHGLRDKHISDPIRSENRRGMSVVEINPSTVRLHFERHTKITMRGKEAFESGEILKAVRRIRLRS